MISLFFIQSCLDEIELDVPRGQSDAVVVQGKLTVGDLTEVSVRVNRIFTFDGTSTTLRVKYVNIINEIGDQLSLDFVEEGSYYKTIDQDDEFAVEAGLSYKINLELFDGRIIESKFEVLKSIDANNEVSLSIKEKPIVNIVEDEVFNRERIIIDLRSEFNNRSDNPQRYRWFVNVTQKIKDIPDFYGVRGKAQKTCYTTSTFPVGDQVLFNGFESDNSGQVLFETEVFDGRVNDVRYLDTAYFNIIQESLTEGAFNYYNSIDKTLELSGSMFDPAAGKIRSNLINISNPVEEVFGYFYASEQVQTNVRVTPDALGNTPRNPCLSSAEPLTLTESQCRWVACCDCNGRSEGIPRKPDYWE